MADRVSAAVVHLGRFLWGALHFRSRSQAGAGAGGPPPSGTGLLTAGGLSPGPVAELPCHRSHVPCPPVTREQGLCEFASLKSDLPAVNGSL